MIPTDPSWDIRPLGEVVDVLDSRRIPVSAKERASRPGRVPYYGAAGQVGWIDEPLFDEPLVLLGEDGVQFFDPIKSKAYLVDGPAWVNNHAHVLRVHAGVDRKFLHYYLNAADYRGLANGTTRLKLTQAAMRRLPVPLPPIDAQRRIIDLLDDHLSRLDAAQGTIESVPSRSIALQESWLGRTLRDAPAGETVQLGDVLRDVRGGWSRSKSHLVTADRGKPYLKMNNITRRGRLDLGDVVHVLASTIDVEKFGVVSGDLLFNSKNSGDLVGKTALADSRVHGSVINENIMRLRFNDRVFPAYAATWFMGPAMRRAILAAACASTNVSAVYQKDLVRFPMWVPPHEQQVAIARSFESLRDATEVLDASSRSVCRHVVSLRRSLLEAAFSGRLTSLPRERDRTEEAS